MYLAQKAQSYKKELELILNSSKHTVAPGREYCENCDPRFKILSSPEKTRNNLLLQKQIRYKDGHVIFNRTFQQYFKYLNPLQYESKHQTLRIAKKLEQYPNILAEYNFKLEKDVNNKKLVFLDQYLKENQISITDYKIGYLPLLMAFNQHSKSTPARLVQAPNRPGPCVNLTLDNSSQQANQDLDTSAETKTADMSNDDTESSSQPKCLSYNDCIKSYD